MLLDKRANKMKAGANPCPSEVKPKVSINSGCLAIKLQKYKPANVNPNDQIIIFGTCLSL